MTRLEPVNRLARQALEHWGAGRLDEASTAYVQAMAALYDAGLPAVADLHAQLAGVLEAQGELDAAITQSALALAAEIDQRGAHDASPGVKVARHFLADRLRRHARLQEALEVLAPSLAVLPDDWLLNLTQAEVLSLAGQPAPARAAAERSLAHAPSDEKRAQLAERLAAVLRG